MKLFHALPIAASALALSTTVAFADPLPIKSVDVSADTDAPEDMVAFDAYPTLSEDITAAVLERAPSLDDTDGVIVHVDIKQLSLDNVPISMDAPEFNELDGVVWFGHDDIVGPINSYAVLLNAYTEATAPADATVILPSSEEFYQGLVNALADNVVENLPDQAALNAISKDDDNS